MIKYFVKFKLFDHPEDSYIIESGSGGFVSIEEVKEQVVILYNYEYDGFTLHSTDVTITALNRLT